MRGKKTDPEFVSLFITGCVKEGIETPNAIVAKAKSMIAEIDEAIKQIEDDKKFRAKLLDVVASFDSFSKIKNEDATLLPFFELKYPDICQYWCNLLKKLPSISTNLSGEVHPNVKFSIKQMLEAHIMSRLNDQLIRGERFEEYMFFISNKM